MLVSVLLIGFGNVSQGFVKSLVDRRDRLREAFGIELSICSVVEVVRGEYHSAFSSTGLDLESLLRVKRQEGVVSAYSNGGGHDSTPDLIKKSRAQLLIEATPTNLRNGEPALTYIKTALESRMDVVTSNKGPLVFALNQLRNLAKLNKVEFKYSAAVAGALPIIPTGDYTLTGAQVSSIEGILNGTTNYILTQMEREGVEMKEGLADAQQKGIAETDPRLDISGDDTAFKLLIAANSIMQSDTKITDVSISGIENVTHDDIMAAKKRGHALKLIGTARKTNSGVDMKVQVEEVGPEHPFFGVNGTSKAVLFNTDILGRIILSGGESNPQLAAGAMLRDILNIYRNSKT
ncbi:MAG: homoserine dehydrogenase [Candidatus Bathyarchaeia archaeon]